MLWPELDYHKRDEEITRRVKFLLAARPGEIISTREIADTLLPGNKANQAWLARRLVKKIAAKLPGYATHDGERYSMGGKSFVRWRWHGGEP